LEDLMDRVARVAVIRHRRSGHLKRAGVFRSVIRGSGREVLGGQYRGAKQELISRWQAGIAAGEVGWWPPPVSERGEIGCRRHIVEGLLLLVGAYEISAAVGPGDDLELMSPGKVLAGRTVGSVDASDNGSRTFSCRLPGT
jgi:hypothetical protein